MSKISKRRGEVRIGGNIRSREAKIGILAGVGLAVVALAVFHSAVIMGGIALVLIILWVILPKRRS
jgi:Flp pilus assembly protein TadB